MAALPLTQRRSFNELQAHYELIKDRHLRELFAEDPERGERLTAEACRHLLDYSKNRVTAETMRLLIELAARVSGLEEQRDAMFGGERINVSEDRSVLHVALRMPSEALGDARWRERGGTGPRGARPDGRVRRARALGGLEGPHGQADPQHRQHRHRRLGPRTGDGL